MSTRVSWIDPSQLQDLVGQLRGPAAEPDADTSAWEVHTLPSEMGLGARELGIPDDDLWLPTEPAPVEPEAEIDIEPFFLPQPAIVEVLPLIVQDERVEPLPEETESEEPNDLAVEEGNEFEPVAIITPSGPPVELNRIREKLQAIRERAIEAGLLAHRPTEAPKAAEVPTIEPTPVPEPIAEHPAIPQPVMPDPVGETGPIEVDQFEVSPPTQPYRIQSPFGLAESPESEDLPDKEARGAEFTLPEEPIMERLGAFATWASGWLQTQELLITDDHGDVLWGEHSQSGLMVTTMMAGKASLRSTALGAIDPLGVTETPIQSARILIAVPCETRFGTLNIGFIRAYTLSDKDAALLRRNIVRALDAV